MRASPFPGIITSPRVMAAKEKSKYRRSRTCSAPATILFIIFLIFFSKFKDGLVKMKNNELTCGEIMMQRVTKS